MDTAEQKSFPWYGNQLSIYFIRIALQWWLEYINGKIHNLINSLLNIKYWRKLYDYLSLGFWDRSNRKTLEHILHIILN